MQLNLVRSHKVLTLCLTLPTQQLPTSGSLAGVSGITGQQAGSSRWAARETHLGDDDSLLTTCLD
jgi:hypothetical protein